MSTKFELPKYPYDQLNKLKALATKKFGKVIDLSIGTPIDPSPPAVKEAFASLDGTEVGYPPSIGTQELLEATATWFENLTGVKLSMDQIGSCVGTKEFIALLPGFLKLRFPDKDTVAGPALAYPTYEMGSVLAGLKYHPLKELNGQMDLSELDDDLIQRILCVFINSPANPTGAIYDLESIREFAKSKNILVVSDECYLEYSWSSGPTTILGGSCDNLLAVHSLSKRSNAAGIRVGSFSGDTEIVKFLKEIRKHAGLMIPGPSQKAAAAAYGDLTHIEHQRQVYRKRLEILEEFFKRLGLSVEQPAGGFYLWIKIFDDARLEGIDGSINLCWRWTTWLALNTGVLVSPGEFYGSDGRDYIRVAAVAKTEDLEALL